MNELLAGLAASFARAIAVAIGAWLTKAGFDAGSTEQIQLGITALIVSGVLVAWRHFKAWIENKNKNK